MRVYDTLGKQNAQYHEGTNQIDLALDADDGALTRVVSHEAFHYIENWNKDAAQKLRNFVLDRLKQNAEYDLEQRVQDFEEKYELAQDENGRESALSEIAADSMLDMIGTEENLKALVNTDKGLTQKIVEWAKKTAKQLHDLIGRFAGRSAEARALTKDAEYIEKIGAMFEEALKQAKENIKMAHKDLFAGAMEDTAVQSYVQEMEGAVSKQERETSISILLSNLFYKTQSSFLNDGFLVENNLEEQFEKFHDALIRHAKKEVSIAKAFQDAGLNVPDKKHNSSLAYAARQALEAMKRGMEGVKYDLKRTESGVVYVSVDRDQQLFTEENKKNWKNIARNYIREYFAGKMLGSDNDILVTNKSAKEYAYPAKRERSGSSVRDGKYRAATELVNILKAGIYIGSAKDDGRHGSATNGWEYYEVIYSIDGKMFSGITQIMLTEDGRRFYDVTKIEEAPWVYESQDRTVLLSYPRGASDERITENEKDVNKKFSLKDEIEENKQIFDKAKEIFGKTYSWNLTGYILPDGTRLDFSWKREGSDGRSRQEDHRSIWEAYGEDTDMSGNEAMIDFMRRGAIRIIPETGGININQNAEITKAQWDALDNFISRMRGEVVVDIDNDNGSTVTSNEFNRGTYSKSIVESIKELLKEGDKSKSTTAQFHGDTLYSMKDKADNADTDLSDMEEWREVFNEEGSADFFVEEMEQAQAAASIFNRMHELSEEMRGTGFWAEKVLDSARRILKDSGSGYNTLALKNRMARLYEAHWHGRITAYSFAYGYYQEYVQD